ncbi:MAG: ABC transporter substrate-binding protein [Magnetococcales bacterium]|nr:ABC transporter substrate-binding protein [Magnetococcales bacterium]
MIQRPIFFIILPLLCLLLMPSALWAQPDNIHLIKSTVNQAITILNDPELSLPENLELRRTRLRETLYKEFDFARMAQGAVGRKWRKFSPSQKEKFIPLFTRILENTYLARVEQYQGEEVEFTKEVRQTKRITRVDSVVTSKSQKYDLSYRLYKDDANWKIFDVIIEGVSVIANYRAQFQQILKNSSVDGLLAKLEEKLEKEEG